MNDLVISHMDAKVLERFENYAHDPSKLHAVLTCYMKGIGVTQLEQSVAVLEYLFRHRRFSTAEEVFTNLRPGFSSLTRTYVNITLKVLAQFGTIEIVNLGMSEAHYDVDTPPHAHLICAHCGDIIDIPLSKSISRMITVPHGAVVNDIQAMCLGMCAKCNRNEKAN